MATCQCDAGFSTCLTCACQYVARNSGRQFIHGPAQDGDGYGRMSAHGIDITDRIGCRNLSKLEGVIDNRCEEVGGTQRGSTMTDINERRIISTTVPNKQGRCAFLKCIDFHRGKIS